MKQEILNILKTELGIHHSKVINIYLFGSRCYNNFNEDSDYDITIVLDTDSSDTEYTFFDYNFHLVTSTSFENKLQYNDPRIIECLLYNPKILENKKYTLSITPKKFRHSVSHTSSNSWVKAKKKIEQNDIYIGQKSLYHSLRIPMFATQIMEHNDIIDWECANSYWYIIKSIDNWDTLSDTFKPIKNEIMSKFRILCPKF